MVNEALERWGCRLSARREGGSTTDTVVNVAGVRFGGGHRALIAGPCAVESLDTMLHTARRLKAMGVGILRAGAYKPRTSPYAFQGLGKEGLEILAEVKRQTGIAVCTEVMDPESLPLVLECADLLQIGARNMQNFSLLRAVGATDRPVLLKRGLSATIQEWLLAAEYILHERPGRFDVILCERGIRTFEPYTRNTLDLGALAAAKTLTHLPVIADPSHGTGRRELVAPLSRAAVAAGADGLILEVHPDPDRSWTSDGAQSLTLEDLERLLDELPQLVEARPRATTETARGESAMVESVG